MKRTRATRGFTIIEVLVGIAIMTVTISSVAVTGVVSVRADTKSHQASATTTLAQAKMDQLRMLPRTHAHWTEGTHSESGLTDGGIAHPSGPYSRQWVIDLDYNGQTDLARVVVTASMGGAQAVTLSSLFW
jgi:prepilin-type N-terminal cleavage/methylation domain-containing protein